MQWFEAAYALVPWKSVGTIFGWIAVGLVVRWALHLVIKDAVASALKEAGLTRPTETPESHLPPPAPLEQAQHR